MLNYPYKINMNKNKRYKIAGTYLLGSVLPDYLKMIITARDKLDLKYSNQKKLKSEQKRYIQDLTNKISEIQKILNNG